MLNASRTVVAGAVLLMLGAGCAQGLASEAEFECANRTVRARFVGDAMQLDAGGEIFRMRSVVAASGAKYQAEDDPSTIFWNKGREAFIQIRGQALGTCAIAAASIEPAPSQTLLRARGNEPGWNLTIGDAEIALVTDYGAKRSTFPKPAPEASGDATHYVVAAANLTITLLERPCADTMSGMFYPLTVTVERPEGVLSGCGGEPASLLLGPERVVESIDGARLIGDSRATIAFQDGGRVAGLASCNRYRRRIDDDGLRAFVDGAGAALPRCTGHGHAL